MTLEILLKFYFIEITTARKVSKYGVFFSPYFPVFGLNMEIYSKNLRIQSENRKIWTRENSVFGHFSRSERSLLCKIVSPLLHRKSFLQVVSFFKNKNQSKRSW